MEWEWLAAKGRNCRDDKDGFDHYIMDAIQKIIKKSKQAGEPMRV